MGIDAFLLFSLAALGMCSGFLAGLLGIGGGMLMVPALTFLMDQRGVAPGLSVKMAIATSMAVIVFTSLSSVRAHHRRGAVRWDVVRGQAPGILAGSLLGSAGIFRVVDGTWLALFFAGFVVFSATQMFLDRKPAPSRQLPGGVGQLGAGAGIGLLSGLVGAGGGFVSVPFMVWCNVAIHQAVATSAALGLPIALANVAGYVWSGAQHAGPLPAASFGYIWLPALALVGLCSVPMAPIGARLAHRLPVRRLKRVFSSLLFLLAFYMAWRGLD